MKGAQRAHISLPYTLSDPCDSLLVSVARRGECDTGVTQVDHEHTSVLDSQRTRHTAAGPKKKEGEGVVGPWCSQVMYLQLDHCINISSLLCQSYVAIKAIIKPVLDLRKRKQQTERETKTTKDFWSLSSMTD
jgi:hypothetical protein